MAERIKQARLRAGISPKKLAEQVGVSRSAVVQWETGDTKGLRPDNLLAAADALRVSVRWLATGDNRDDAPASWPAREEAPAYHHLKPETVEVARQWQALPNDVRELIRQFIYGQSLLASLSMHARAKTYKDFEKHVIAELRTKRGGNGQ